MRLHWTMRAVEIARAVLDQISDERWWDGLILGLAAAALPFIVWLWWSGG